MLLTEIIEWREREREDKKEKGVGNEERGNRRLNEKRIFFILDIHFIFFLSFFFTRHPNYSLCFGEGSSYYFN